MNSYGFTVYEYLFFIDLCIDENCIRNIFDKAKVLDGCITNSIALHASHTIEETAIAIPLLIGTEFEQSFSQSIEINIKAKKYQIKHDKNFFNVQFWEFKKINFIKKYHQLYSEELENQIKNNVN